ncbi:MAG: hypothetical protein KGJ62_15240 [Armatimonadetes bacterium]|nr:hypothetical protein [Armatimonadota bacterium]MDE2207526.1 hypothetical protein [Armatimonadota bacterium]
MTTNTNAPTDGVSEAPVPVAPAVPRLNLPQPAVATAVSRLRLPLNLRGSNPRLIWLMWGSTAVVWVASIGLHLYVFGAVLDLGATALGGVLAMMPNRIDKRNGILKLALQFSILVATALLLAHGGMLRGFLHDAVRNVP